MQHGIGYLGVMHDHGNAARQHDNQRRAHKVGNTCQNSVVKRIAAHAAQQPCHHRHDQKQRGQFRKVPVQLPRPRGRLRADNHLRPGNNREDHKGERSREGEHDRFLLARHRLGQL